MKIYYFPSMLSIIYKGCEIPLIHEENIQYLSETDRSRVVLLDARAIDIFRDMGCTTKFLNRDDILSTENRVKNLQSRLAEFEKN